MVNEFFSFFLVWLTTERPGKIHQLYWPVVSHVKKKVATSFLKNVLLQKSLKGALFIKHHMFDFFPKDVDRKYNELARKHIPKLWFS